MPRIRDVKDLVFYKADRRRRYKNIEALFRASIDWTLIEDTRQHVFVDMVSFGESAINIEIVCFTKTVDQKEWRRIRQSLFLKVIDIIHAAGAEIPFHTTTVLMHKD